MLLGTATPLATHSSSHGDTEVSAGFTTIPSIIVRSILASLSCVGGELLPDLAAAVANGQAQIDSPTLAGGQQGWAGSSPSAGHRHYELWQFRQRMFIIALCRCWTSCAMAFGTAAVFWPGALSPL